MHLKWLSILSIDVRLIYIKNASSNCKTNIFFYIHSNYDKCVEKQSNSLSNTLDLKRWVDLRPNHVTIITTKQSLCYCRIEVYCFFFSKLFLLLSFNIVFHLFMLDWVSNRIDRFFLRFDNSKYFHSTCFFAHFEIFSKLKFLAPFIIQNFEKKFVFRFLFQFWFSGIFDFFWKIFESLQT